MDRYTISQQLGNGTFGVVYKAIHNSTGEEVAVKRMKQTFNTWNECLQLREVQVLRRLQHQNVIKLKEVIREKNALCLIFELMDENVLQVANNRKDKISGHISTSTGLNEKEIRSIITQALLGLQHCHKAGYFHRDLKPENLLTKGDTVKLADFGLAKEIRSRIPRTEYVSTRWYRAPELILRSPNYNSPVDIWALGVIMAELYTLVPLFPGTSDADQLYKFCSLRGTPSQNDWEEGYLLAKKLNIKFPQIAVTPLKQILPQASTLAIDFIESMLHFNPQNRPTVNECLRHPFISGHLKNQSKVNLSLYQGIASKAPHNPFLV